MTSPQHAPNENAEKDTSQWVTGDEPMTASQRSYLETLASDNGETFDDNLTKADASKLIDELRQRSPRLAGERCIDGQGHEEDRIRSGRRVNH